MTTLRRHLLTHRVLALWFMAFTMLASALIPAGFMPVASANGITLTLCSGTGPETMTMAMPGMAHKDGKAGDHRKAEPPCGFAGAGAPALESAAPLIWALAIAFILAAGFSPARAVALAATAFLRPPLRGPPAAA